jgi:hypothetical protein
MASDPNPAGGAYLGAPPQLPNLPDADRRLADYLRVFSLWCQGNFNSTLQKRSATGALYMTSTTGDSVWQITIDDAGVLHTARMNPGQGP